MATPATMMHSSRRMAIVADILLFSVAIFWGGNFVFIKSAVERTSAIAGGSIVAGTMLYLLLRYVVATGIFAAAQPKSWLKASRRDWKMGGLLGSFYLTALILQTFGLHIMTTGFFAPKVHPSTLAVTQMIVSTAALAVLTPFFVHITLDLPWQVWAVVVWTALSGTIYAFFIQSWAQRYTTSTHAAILLGFESVFAAIAGIAFGMDSVTWRLLMGGSLMLTGVFIVELLPSSKGVVAEIEAEEGS